MARFVVLISGRGSNLQAIHSAMIREAWSHELAAVLSNRPEAAGLDLARGWGVPVQVVDHRAYASRQAFDAALVQAVTPYAPDLVALAGFMRILSPVFLDAFAGRVMNIHPALLPAFTGLNTHARALAAGVRLHGATTHLVTAELDAGPIVMQGALPVRAEDTPASLAQRVLAIEHRLYPLSVRAWLDGRVRLHAGHVVWARPEGAASTAHPPYLWLDDSAS